MEGEETNMYVYSSVLNWSCLISLFKKRISKLIAFILTLSYSFFFVSISIKAMPLDKKRIVLLPSKYKDRPRQGIVMK